MADEDARYFADHGALVTPEEQARYARLVAQSDRPRSTADFAAIHASTQVRSCRPE